MERILWDLYSDVSFGDLSHVESDSRNHILIELPTLRGRGDGGVYKNVIIHTTGWKNVIIHTPHRGCALSTCYVSINSLEEGCSMAPLLSTCAYIPLHSTIHYHTLEESQGTPGSYTATYKAQVGRADNKPL